MPKIIKNQGASEMRFNSGGSLNFANGAGLQLNEGATATATPYELFKMGNNTMWYLAGSGTSPTFAASPGDFLLFANSASTGLFANISNGTTGSRWTSFRRTDAGSQIPS